MTTDAWQIRIRGSGIKPAAEFIANPFNYKIHTALQNEVVNASLDQVGWVRRVLVNTVTGHLVDGHERVTLAMAKSPQTPVPYEEVELTEEEELLVLSLLDPVIALAVIEKERLQQLMDAVHTDEEHINSFLNQLAQENGVLFANVDGGGGSSLDFSQFNSPENPILKYRLIVEDLSFEDAQRMMAEIPNSRFEQYRADVEETNDEPDRVQAETTG